MAAKNLVILTRPSNIFFINAAKITAKKLKINLIILNPNEIDLPLEKFIETKSNLLPPPNETLLWNRVSGTTYNDYDQLVATNWQLLGATALNCLNVHHIYRNKFYQYLHLRNAELPLIPTYYLPNQQLDMIPSAGPFVVKTLRGAKGKGVIKVEDKKALVDFLTLTHSMGDDRFIIQDFVAYQQEHRLLVTKGKVIGHYIKNNSSAHWKHNLSNAKWEICSETPIEMLEIVEKIDQLEQKFFYAVDIICKNGQLAVLEVNICPGIEGPDGLRETSILEEVLDFI